MQFDMKSTRSKFEVNTLLLILLFNIIGFSIGFNNWLPWTSNWPAPCCCGGRTVQPQPMLSDIEFNVTTGEMVIGFIDRFGHQSGFDNYELTGTALFGGVSGGEILKSTPAHSSIVALHVTHQDNMKNVPPVSS